VIPVAIELIAFVSYFFSINSVSYAQLSQNVLNMCIVTPGEAIASVEDPPDPGAEFPALPLLQAMLIDLLGQVLRQG
jgi:hypothetical protein